MPKHNHLKTRTILDPVPVRRRPVIARRINAVLRELGSALVKIKVLLLILAVIALVQLNRFDMPAWMFADHVERTAEAAWPGTDLSIGAAQLQLGQDGRASQIILSDVVLRSSDGAVLAQAPQVRGGFSALELLQGRWLPRSLDVDGVSTTLIRSESGALSLSVSPDGAGVSLPAGQAQQQGINLAAPKESEPLQGLEEIRITQGTVHLYDLAS
ncbi:MAG: hypothetical protein AAGA78_13090, partial [Pseudomonadota bacterium]